jgi:hypothetical protein
VNVSRRGPYRVHLDTFLLPQTVHRGTVQVLSGRLAEFLSIRFDPLDREIVAVPFRDAPLYPRVAYRLRVEGVVDFEGRPLAEPFEVAFETGGDLGETPQAPSASWDDVGPLLAARCSGEGCHGPSSPAVGLDLSSATGARATAIGVAATETRSGSTGLEGARGGFALSGLPIIDVVGEGGRPATSYLVYKILGAEAVFGERMPPPGHQPLTYGEIRLISDWIVSGAPTD